MEQFTINPPKDPVNGYYITKPVTIGVEFVGPVIRMRYTFRDPDVDPLEVGGIFENAPEKMLAELVDCYISSVENRDADDRHAAEIISELEGFIEATPSNGSE